MELLFASLMIFGQVGELPEPVMPPITYETEIAWGTKTVTQTWTPIIPKSVTVSAGVAATSDAHNYNGKIGDNTLEFIASDSTAEAPKKVDVVLTITDIPKQKPFDYFRIRVRATMMFNGSLVVSEWSDPSFWIAVQKLPKGSQPVGK